MHGLQEVDSVVADIGSLGDLLSIDQRHTQELVTQEPRSDYGPWAVLIFGLRNAFLQKTLVATNDNPLQADNRGLAYIVERIVVRHKAGSLMKPAWQAGNVTLLLPV